MTPQNEVQAVSRDSPWAPGPASEAALGEPVAQQRKEAAGLAAPLKTVPRNHQIAGTPWPNGRSGRMPGTAF